MKILIVKLSAVGDVVMSLPFLEVLRATYPRARLDWLVEEAAADVVVDHPLLDRVLVSRRRSWGRDMGRGEIISTFRDIYRFLKELRHGGYDLAVDLQGLFKSGILIWLSKADRRVGFDKTREFSWLFINERLAPYDPDRHALLRYLDVAFYLGAGNRREALFRMPRGEAAAGEAELLLGGVRGVIVAVNPGAKWETKLWPAASWRELCRRLAEAPGIGVIITGSVEEIGVNEKIGRDLEGVLDLTGRTSLKVLAEIYRTAKVVICPDTGPMHLAAAVGTPVVALFGPTAPRRTGPFGPQHSILQRQNHCGPCFKKRCDHWHCMTDLKPEDVYQAAMQKLRLRTGDFEDTAHGMV